jgi:Uma2 family endonuclease
LKIRSRNHENGYYPDVMVCCDPTDNHELYREKPIVVVEVVSDSSRITDKTLKKADYFTLPSLREYVVVEQERMEVTIYRRLDDGWEEEICTQGDTVRLTPIGFTCAIEELYLKVEPAP